MSAAAATMLPAEEAGLVSDMARGDADALGVLFDRYGDLLMGLAVRMLGRVEEAEELVHDVFVEAWKKASTFDPGRGTVRAWLVTRTRSRALDRIRAPKRARTTQVGEPPRDEPDRKAGDPSEEIDHRRVKEALAALTQPQREVIELSYFRGLSSSEISGALGIPIGTVKSRMAAGLRSLRTRLQGEPLA